MRSGHVLRSLLALAALQIGAACATPLTAPREPDGALPAIASRATSAGELARADASFEIAPERLAFEPLPDVTSESSLALPGAADPGRSLRHDDLYEQLRSFVNVERGRVDVAQGARRNRAQTPGPEFAGIDLGEAAEAWIRDSVKSLLESALRLEVDERGRATFSIFGIGEFSVTVARGGSAFILSEGDEVLLVAQRPPSAQGGGAHAGSDMPLSAIPVRYAAVEQWSLREAVDQMLDVASHPLSLLVYCIIAAYMLIGTMLARQKRSYRIAAPVGVPAAASGHMAAAVSASSTRGSRRSRSRSGFALRASPFMAPRSASSRRHRRRSRSRRTREG